MLRFVVSVASVLVVAAVMLANGKFSVPRSPDTHGARYGASDSCGAEYVVQAGDTLSEVAERIYGKNARYQEIFEANLDRLNSPAEISVGDVLRIPCLERAGSRPGAATREDVVLASIEGQVARPTGAISGATADPTPDPAAVTAAGLIPRTRPETTSIRLAAVAGFAPYSDREAEHGGMLAALITRALATAGAGQEMKLGFTEDWFGNLAGLKAGERFDIGFPWVMPDCDAGDALSPELRKICAEYQFSEALVEVPVAFYVRSGDSLAGVRELSELSGKRLCQGRDVPPLALDRRGRALAGVEIGSAPNTATCLSRLHSGEADLAAAVGPMVTGQVRHLGLEAAVQPVPALATRRTLHAIAPKAAPGAVERLAALDHGLTRMKRSGAWFEVVAAANARLLGD